MDSEVSGQGNQYDYGFRIYNPRLGKFLSVDPLFKGFPMLTPYQFANNIPIAAIDLDGLESVIKCNSPATSEAIKCYAEAGNFKDAYMVAIKTLKEAHQNPDGSMNETDFTYSRADAYEANRKTGLGQKEGDFPGTFNYSEQNPKGFTVYGVDGHGNDIIVLRLVPVESKIDVDPPKPKNLWYRLMDKINYKLDNINPPVVEKETLTRNGVSYYTTNFDNNLVGQNQGKYNTTGYTENIDATAWLDYYGAGGVGDLTTLGGLIGEGVLKIKSKNEELVPSKKKDAEYYYCTHPACNLNGDTIEIGKSVDEHTEVKYLKPE